MINSKKRLSMFVMIAFALFFSLSRPATGSAAEAHNVRFVGHHDLQRRPALQVVLKGDFAYVGHHSGAAFNPLSGKREHNGTSIVDVSDPSQPALVHHIPAYAGAESRAVQVVENYYKGRDFLVISEEAFASNCRELRRQIYIVDATVETNPVPVATFKVPDNDFCSRGGCRSHRTACRVCPGGPEIYALDMMLFLSHRTR